MKAQILIFLLTGLFNPLMQTEQGTILLHLENIESKKGTIKIALFENEASFLKDDSVPLNKVVEVKEVGNTLVRINDIPFGTYAIAVYHDLNNNDKLDKNILGIPKEPYAFSNNPKVKWKSPSFEESKFDYSTDQQTVRLVLKRWKAQ